MFSPIFASKLVGEMASERYHMASSSDTTADHQCSPVSELGDQSDGKSGVSSTSSAEMLLRDELAADEVDSEASESKILVLERKTTASDLRTAKQLDIGVTSSQKVAKRNDLWGALKLFIGHIAAIDGHFGDAFPHIHALIAMTKDLLRRRPGLLPHCTILSILLRCLWDGAIVTARDLDGRVLNLEPKQWSRLALDTDFLIHMFYAGKDKTWKPPPSLPPPTRLASPRDNYAW